MLQKEGSDADDTPSLNTGVTPLFSAFVRGGVGVVDFKVEERHHEASGHGLGGRGA